MSFSLELINLHYIYIFYAFSFQTKSMVGSILVRLANRFTYREQIKKLKLFAENIKNEYGSLATIPRAINNAEYNLNWADKNMPTIIAYLKDSNSDGVRPHASLLLIALMSISYYLFVQ